MSDNIYDDDYSDESDESSNGPKALREALKKAHSEAKAKAKEFEDLSTKFESLNKKVTEQSLADLLREKQVPANIAKWIKRDGIDSTAEAVDEWLKDNGDDFGYKPGEPRRCRQGAGGRPVARRGCRDGTPPGQPVLAAGD